MKLHYVASLTCLPTLTLLFLLSPSTSDLIMKVDALLTAAPKGEVRRDVHFIKDSHRWTAFIQFPVLTVLLLCGDSAFVILVQKIATSSFHAVQKGKSFDLQFC